MAFWRWLSRKDKKELEAGLSANPPKPIYFRQGAVTPARTLTEALMPSRKKERMDDPNPYKTKIGDTFSFAIGSSSSSSKIYITSK